MPGTLVVFVLTLFFLFFLLASAHPLPRPLSRISVTPRDVEANGPSGILDLTQRWRDTVGTATQVWQRGPALKNSVIRASRTGPMSSVYRDALTTVRRPCTQTGQDKCEVAINGFGSVGEVQYTFNDAIANTKGRSTQVMVACRCLGRECGQAILIRPVNVFDGGLPNNPDATPDRRTCLYEAVGNSFSDCHYELLRGSRRAATTTPLYTHGRNAFVYTVDDKTAQANWTARGQRGFTRDCTAAQVEALPTVPLSTSVLVKPHIHTTLPDNNCVPPESVTYFRDEDPAVGEACAATYGYAAAAAAHAGSQQDEYAVGNRPDSYMEPKPELVSNTELALVCVAAGLGILFVWGIFRKQLKKRNKSLFYLAKVIIIQVLSYSLEALPLHMALAQEISARDWMSEFAFVDGTLALASDQRGTQGSAMDSILVLTAALGIVQWQHTRVNLVAALTVAFDLTAIVIIVMTLARRGQFIARAWRKGDGVAGRDGWGARMARHASRRQADAVSLQASALSWLQQGRKRSKKKADESHDDGQLSMLASTASTITDVARSADVLDMVVSGLHDTVSPGRKRAGGQEDRYWHRNVQQPAADVTAPARVARIQGENSDQYASRASSGPQARLLRR